MKPRKKQPDPGGTDPFKNGIELDDRVGGTNGDAIAEAQRLETNFDVEDEDVSRPKEQGDDEELI